jgi:hypothetical protein
MGEREIKMTDGIEIIDSDIAEVIDPYFHDPAVVKFTGGPLDGQTRRMEVYVPVIPVYSYGFYDAANNMTRAYYQNVNATAGISDDLRQIGAVHYVFFIDGKRVS